MTLLLPVKKKKRKKKKNRKWRNEKQRSKAQLGLTLLIPVTAAARNDPNSWKMGVEVCRGMEGHVMIHIISSKDM